MSDPSPTAPLPRDAPLVGAIIGDMVGSRFEGKRHVDPDFGLIAPTCRYTDDTVLSCAVAEWMLGDADLTEALRDWYHADPFLPYGSRFKAWARDPAGHPTDSFANGAIMRLSPVPILARDREDVLARAHQSVLPTHDHPDARAAARQVALAIWRLQDGAPRDVVVREARMSLIGHAARHDIDPRTHAGGLTALATALEAFECVEMSATFEAAIRQAVVRGGDTDTRAAVAGSIAAAAHPIPESLREWAESKLSTRIKAVIARVRDRIAAA